MIEIEELWALIDESVHALPGCGMPLRRAVGRILAADAVSRVHSPGFDQSSMDGYAFADVPGGSCAINGTIAAGDRPKTPLASGDAVRIFTGAPLPAGAVCVARQEDCEVEAGRVRLRPGATLVPGQNIRRRGGVLAPGDVVLAAGTCILPGAVALLIMAEISDVEVIRPAAVTHLATGAELADAGQPLSPGRIHDSNGPLIQALARAAGLPVARRRLGDDPTKLDRAVGAFQGDLLLISGGSGPGDHDHAPRALRDNDFTIHASRINSRPGGPLIFATRGRQVAFGLPGNPLSHWVCYQAFVRRALARLHGDAPPELVHAALTEPLPLTAEARRTWTPASVSIKENVLLATPIPWKHSGDLTPLAKSNALILDSPRAGFCRMLLL